MLFQVWPGYSTKQLLKRLCQVSWVSSLTLMVVLLSQHTAFAHPIARSQDRAAVLENVYLVIGLFTGSLLIVESRRLSTFILGVLLLTTLAVAIAPPSRYYTLSPALEHLWPSAVIGLGLGIILVGGWWWGYRQGYGQALFRAITGRKQDALPLNLPIQSHESDQFVGFFRELSNSASVIRYRRMLSRREVKALYTLIKDEIHQDWQQEQADHCAKQRELKRSHIRLLLTEADHICKQ